jgi:hypothetical protein
LNGKYHVLKEEVLYDGEDLSYHEIGRCVESGFGNSFDSGRYCIGYLIDFERSEAIKEKI